MLAGEMLLALDFARILKKKKKNNFFENRPEFILKFGAEQAILCE